MKRSLFLAALLIFPATKGFLRAASPRGHGVRPFYGRRYPPRRPVVPKALFDELKVLDGQARRAFATKQYIRSKRIDLALVAKVRKVKGLSKIVAVGSLARLAALRFMEGNEAAAVHTFDEMVRAVLACPPPMIGQEDSVLYMSTKPFAVVGKGPLAVRLRLFLKGRLSGLDQLGSRRGYPWAVERCRATLMMALGELHLQQGNFPWAKKYFEKAITLGKILEKESKTSGKLTGYRMACTPRLFAATGMLLVSQREGHQAALRRWALEVERLLHRAVTEAKVPKKHVATVVATRVLEIVRIMRPDLFRAVKSKGPSLPPAKDPELFSVSKVSIRTKRYGRSTRISTAYVKARLSRKAAGPKAVEGRTRVYLYWDTTKGLRLAGTGWLQSRPARTNRRAFEASITNLCTRRLDRWLKPARSYKTKPDRGVLRAIDRNREHLFLSFVLKGEDALSWSPLQRDLYGRSRFWVGLAEHAFRAATGVYKRVSRSKGRVTYVFYGKTPTTTLSGGRVVQVYPR